MELYSIESALSEWPGDLFAITARKCEFLAFGPQGGFQTFGLETPPIMPDFYERKANTYDTLAAARESAASGVAEPIEKIAQALVKHVIKAAGFHQHTGFSSSQNHTKKMHALANTTLREIDLQVESVVKKLPAYAKGPLFEVEKERPPSGSLSFEFTRATAMRAAAGIVNRSLQALKIDTTQGLAEKQEAVRQKIHEITLLDTLTPGDQASARKNALAKFEKSRPQGAEGEPKATR